MSQPDTPRIAHWRVTIGQLQGIVARYRTGPFHAIALSESKDKRVIIECLRLSEELFNEMATRNDFEPIKRVS